MWLWVMGRKKVSVVGSITTIKPEELQVGTTRSLSNTLAGKLAGVIGVQRSGEPGYDSSQFWIRGFLLLPDTMIL